MSSWGVTPRQSIAAECGRRGQDAVIAGCVALLNGDAADADLLRALAGQAARAVLRGEAGGVDGYWPRVWGARGLLYAWDDSATAAVVQATSDEAWRVREMALKVIVRHRVGDAIEAAARLGDDPVLRVRRAAHRAVERLVDAGA
ncbi:MAG TPA: hypothetical protein VFB78_19055 [Acidimicrobiales bacterium]|nr:hypothetical protein [Acidimicrobiales bacterium]